MNFYEITEKLKELLQPMNEMAIKFGQNLNTKNPMSVRAAIDEVCRQKQGNILVDKTIKIKKIVTTTDIQYLNCPKEWLNVKSTLEFPLYIVWGEPTTSTNKEGHSIVHILQEHEQEFNSLKEILQQSITKGKVATLDKNNNYSFETSKYKFVFSITTDNGGWDVVWTTGFDKTKRKS